MTLEEIKEMKVPSAKNSLLFLWTTAPKLEEGIEVLNAWGYSYRSHAVWEKTPGLGMGYYFRINHEDLLIGKKGNINVPAPENRYPSIFRHRIREHSQKPDLVYDMIEKMYPGASKIELFARRRREGWSAWGNQVNDTLQTVLIKEKALV